jgi:hypothetical protein
LDAHSSFYTGSDFRQLNANAVQGLLGVSWEFAPGKNVGLSISEDLTIRASPDFVFNLYLTLPF